MKNTSNTKKKYTLLTIGALVIIIASLLVYYFITKTNNTAYNPTTKSSTPNITAPTTKEQSEAGNEAKKDTINKGVSFTTPQAASDIAISISASQQNDQMFQIRTLINKVMGSGSCTIVLAKTASTTITKTADIQTLSSSSTCKGFDIPLSELSVGNWTVEITARSNDEVAKITSIITVR
jgi:uncharacterized membrane protein